MAAARSQKGQCPAEEVSGADKGPYRLFCPIHKERFAIMVRLRLERLSIILLLDTNYNKSKLYALKVLANQTDMWYI